MRQRTLLRRLITVLTLLAFLVQGTWVLAGTTGQIVGTLVDASSHAPIPNARVTAASPSQTVTVTTDASGNFSFVSLAPDTYTISASINGYQPASVAGVTVQADQTQRVALSTTRALQVIGTTTARAASELVRPGTTADVYSVNAATQQAASVLGGGGSLNQAYSAIASVPGTYVPQGQSGWAQSVYVRGGDYTQLGYEYDGIPVQRAFDQYPGNTVSSLGQQELQVYTGAAPANAASTGLAGYINQVIRTGTYPPTTTVEAATGGPAFYRKAQFETGGANANRTFSYYAAAAGYDQQYRIGSQYNGNDFSSLYGSPYGILATGCGTAHPSAGCYANTNLENLGFAPLGPNGYAFGPVSVAAINVNQDREAVANLHFGLPKKNGTRDDIQMLYETSFLRTNSAAGLNFWGDQASDVVNGTITQNGVVYPSCTTLITNNCAIPQASAPTYFDTSQYVGPVGGVLTSANLTQVSPYLFPMSPTGRPFFANIDPNNTDTYNIRTGIGKLQYQRNLNERSFLRVYGYTFYSDWMNNGPNGFNYNLVSTFTPDYELISHTRGLSLSYVNQITDKHLLDFTGTYTYSNTVRWNNQFYANQPVAVLVDSTNPTSGICYNRTTLAPVYCGSSNAGQYRVSPDPSAGTLVPYRGSPNLATVGSLTCGAGPCEYYVVGSGTGNGSYNTVQPRFTSLSLTDDWHPTPRLTMNLGLKYDIFRYDLAPTDTPSGPLPQPVPAAARQLFVNSFNLFNCFNPVTAVVVSATSPGVCPSGTNPIQYTTTSSTLNQYITWSPRVGMTYQLGPTDVIRASWGKYIQPASSAFQQYNASTTNILAATANQALLSLGTYSPQRIVSPEYSYNTDASWEHSFRNTDVSLKLSPFYRTTQGEIVNVLLDPKTNFVSGINVGNKQVWGAELEVRKGDFNRNGFAALLSYTYTDGKIRFNRLPNGLTVVDAVNGSIGQYNAYTSACAGAVAHGPANSPCYDRFGNLQLTTGGTTAAPCFTAAGAPDPTCAAGSIANPYWNAPPQPKFDANADYKVYNQLPGSGLSAVASSYIVPHVATLILNYKHDKWSITPSLQFAAGGWYGSPVVGFGVDPAAGCAPLAAGTVPGDPRYQYGAPGGAPYDASTCASGIVTPDQYTKQFDTFGAFREPSSLVGNLQISYQASPNVTLRLTAANLLNRCWGGSNEPWNVGYPLNCWYTTGYLGNVGNFYNPGDVIQPAVAFPYGPSIAQVFQQTYGGQANPFNIFFTATIRLH